MNLSVLAKHFSDEGAAREYLEQLRWPDGPICPKCGSVDAYRLTPRPTSKSPARPGVWKCKACRTQFTVTVGTIFEDSHVPLSKWLLAIHLLCASKKGMSAHQIHRMLGVTYKTAWFMMHRIRYAMTQPPLVDKLQGIVEANEAYVGGKRRGVGSGHKDHKTPVMVLVERGGEARSFRMERVTSETLGVALLKNVDFEARLMTDEHPGYVAVGRAFADHQAVNHHLEEYVRGDAHVNTAEGYIATLKRGITGVYHHVGRGHLHRYLAEFDRRYSTRRLKDGARVVGVIQGAEGKRLMFKEPRKTL